MATGESSLREARAAAGLSQVALAAASGVSRQSVGAIESGLHRPSVDAALALARAVGRSVEDVFGSAQADAEAVVGPRLQDGRPVLAARVGDRVVYAAAETALSIEGWPQANAVLERGRPRLLPGADLDGFVIVGCDPALGSLAAMLPRSGPRRLIALSGSTTTALDAMRSGQAHGALVHDRSGRLPAPPAGVLRLHLARWRVGVASRGRRARSIGELCDRQGPVVQREPGASSQKAFAAAVASHGGEPLRGPIASGHVEVARRVAAGAAAGVTIEPAALQFGLAFTGLEEHVAELWVDCRWRAHPAAEAMASTLRSAAFQSRLALIEGYELAGCGAEQGEDR